jgi:pimeloyl-ACP methyl ester carboxylesterase
VARAFPNHHRPQLVCGPGTDRPPAESTGEPIPTLLPLCGAREPLGIFVNEVLRVRTAGGAIPWRSGKALGFYGGAPMNPHRSDFARTKRGIRVHYRLEGAGDPLVLIHGHGDTSSVWLDCLPTLADHYLVTAIDLPGHGKSDRPKTEYSLSFMAGCVADFLEATQNRPCHLVGHSLGGAVVVELALSRPSVARRLVLVDAPLPGVPHMRVLPTSLPLAIPGLGELLCAVTPRILYRAARKRSYSQTLSLATDRLESILEDGLANLKNPDRRHVFLSTLRCAIRTFVLEGRAYSEALARLDKLTLVAHGRQDALVPVSHAEATAKLIPNSTLRIIDNCGHVPQVEKTDEFCEHLLSFLALDQTR